MVAFVSREDYPGSILLSLEGNAEAQAQNCMNAFGPAVWRGGVPALAVAPRFQGCSSHGQGYSRTVSASGQDTHQMPARRLLCWSRGKRGVGILLSKALTTLSETCPPSKSWRFRPPRATELVKHSQLFATEIERLPAGYIG